MTFKKLAISSGIALLALFLVAKVVISLSATKLQTLVSPDGQFEATLSRRDGIDRNYSVRINGTRVYSSPDFSPSQRFAFREALSWDESGTIVVLEIGRHRIFGYDAVHERRLTDEELLALELAPEPPLWEYFFESEWPGIGRARRPE